MNSWLEFTTEEDSPHVQMVVFFWVVRVANCTVRQSCLLSSVSYDGQIFSQARRVDSDCLTTDYELDKAVFSLLWEVVRRISQDDRQRILDSKATIDEKAGKVRSSSYG